MRLSLVDYLKNSALEFVLVFFCSWMMARTLMSGFMVDEALQYGPVPAALIAVLLVVFYLASWRRDRLAFGVGMVLAAVAVMVAASIAFTSEVGIYEDAPGNYLFFTLLNIVACALCFLLTRTLLGSALWFVACVFTCAIFEGMYQRGDLLSGGVVLLTAFALVIWRNCMLTQRSADTLRRVSRPVNFATAVVAALVAFFVLRRRRRVARLRGFIVGHSASEQAQAIYLFLLGKMRHLGMAVPVGSTLLSWSAMSARSMEGLRDETKVPFSALTQTYVKCAYGGYEPTEDEVVPFIAFYESFWKAARAHLGNLKYFFKSFRLG